MSKHAFLILAHRQDETLRTLLDMLDDTRNDIFLHFDKKSGPPSSSFYSMKWSNIEIYNTITVNWGGYSQIEAELFLLKQATSKKNYEYYHLLSGQDLPIQTQDYIHAFFKKNSGKEFVNLNLDNFIYDERVRYYHFFQEGLGKAKITVPHVLNKLQRLIQKVVGIHRNEKIIFRSGSQWFSITNELAKFVIENESWIEKTFKNTLCGDEIFLQTIVINSDFKNNLFFPDQPIVSNNLRFIEWENNKQPSPRTFTSDDFEKLKNSNMLFARKFDYNYQSEVIQLINKEYS
ncbi:glycosyl transferase [Suicoccus acidiformans]|uniref:Peptide O-xylosyltransferase n=1 Tax=Suicoccus acidiformans TaxID=2036206 RepID=A0A347WJP6_9LACT|nr:beta-1,6-N-acetylglucosaminyltransferase [Suicoccus acidiformans]AXY25303.1 glycosyl transferase [Suicoccus acidiformans]